MTPTQILFPLATVFIAAMLGYGLGLRDGISQSTGVTEQECARRVKNARNLERSVQESKQTKACFKHYGRMSWDVCDAMLGFDWDLDKYGKRYRHPDGPCKKGP